MEPTLASLAIAIGLCVGIVVGALGAGGGILSVPILVYLLQVPPHQAAFASLVIVFFTALASLPGHVRQGNVRWAQGIVFGVVAIAGSVIGSQANLLVPEPILMFSFTLLLAAVSAVMGHKAWANWDENRRGSISSGGRGFSQSAQNVAGSGFGNTKKWFSLVLGASFTGLLTGFFGVGGGFAVVPVLVLLYRFPMRQASATSLVVMVIAALSSLLSRFTAGVVNPDWGIVFVFTIGSMLGGFLGALITRRVPSYMLTFCFSALLLVVAVVTGSLTWLSL